MRSHNEIVLRHCEQARKNLLIIKLISLQQPNFQNAV
jgi:hypothetical protein